MANTPSSRKRIRQNAKHRAHNIQARSTLRTSLKQATASLEKADKTNSKAAVSAAIKALGKASSHGLIHKKNAARRISRLQRKLNTSKA